MENNKAPWRNWYLGWFFFPFKNGTYNFIEDKVWKMHYHHLLESNFNFQGALEFLNSKTTKIIIYQKVHIYIKLHRQKHCSILK